MIRHSVDFSYNFNDLRDSGLIDVISDCRGQCCNWLKVVIWK
jgi:hypothetical protein